MKNKVVNSLKWFYNSMIWVFLLVFIVDIVSKQIAQYYLSLNGTITLIPGFLSFQLVINTGAGFGIFKDIQPDWLRRFCLIGISVLMTGAFFIYYGVRFKKLKISGKVGVMLLAGGAFGNLIDRAFYPDGGVIDFIHVDLGNYKTFPTFNIADSVLVCGIIYIIVLLIIEEIKQTKEANKLLDEKDKSLNSSNSIASKEESEEIKDKVEEKHEDNN